MFCTELAPAITSPKAMPLYSAIVSHFTEVIAVRSMTTPPFFQYNTPYPGFPPLFPQPLESHRIGRMIVFRVQSGKGCVGIHNSPLDACSPVTFPQLFHHPFQPVLPLHVPFFRQQGQLDMLLHRKAGGTHSKASDRLCNPCFMVEGERLLEQIFRIG